MEYIVGSVAALVSGNVTPSRPRGLKRAATPVKHQPSPNITPKSEFVDDRSIFLSPTTQKKKAIVKKSPKRIFQNPDLDVTDENEKIMSPKADKVKKHLKNELGGEETSSPKKKKLKKKYSELEVNIEDLQPTEEKVVSKKSHKRKISDTIESKEKLEEDTSAQELDYEADNIPIKNKKKKTKKNKNESEILIQNHEDATVLENSVIPDNEKNSSNDNISKKKKKKLKNTKNSRSTETPSKKIKVNPNAITNKDTDSEHESDNEIESENDEKMNEVLQNDKSASEDEEENTTNNSKPKKIALKDPSGMEEGEAIVHDPEEVNRTLFVGNVPFSKKCKKEIKKIFSSYGDIETVRIRSIPVKDPRFTPKMAIIRNELHPERSSVNVYVKYKRPDSVQQALCENGRVVSAHTLRVSSCRQLAGSPPCGAAVFVGNVPFSLSDDELRAVFAPCGPLHSVRLVRDTQGVGKGFGYVNFESKDSVELALGLTPSQRTVKNRELRVKRCTQSQRDRDKEHGGPGRGHAGMGGQRGMRGRGHTGMRGGGQPGMRPHGQSEMRGGGMRGHRGMRDHGRGGASFRGHGRGGASFRGHGRGGTSVRGHGHTNTDTPSSDKQGAFRRLEHKKKKNGVSEFVGLTPDNKTKRKANLSHKQKAVAEIMSK